MHYQAQQSLRCSSWNRPDGRIQESILDRPYLRIRRHLRLHGEGHRTDRHSRQRGLFEIVIAPDFDKEALEAFSKKKNLRVLRLKPSLLSHHRQCYGTCAICKTSVSSSKRMQSHGELAQFQCVTGTLAKKHIGDASFAWSVVKHLTSNAIFIAKDERSLGF